jgi:hypothetical protein
MSNNTGDFVVKKRTLVQTGLRLDSDLLDKLRNTERGTSDEIRDRLKWTLDLEPLDKPTKELLEAVARIAAEIELETGTAWHEHAGSHAAFRQAILSRLARNKPEGPTAFGDRPHQSQPGPDAPEEIGIWTEYRVWEWRDRSRDDRDSIRAALEQSYREILQLRTQREQEGDKS